MNKTKMKLGIILAGIAISVATFAYNTSEVTVDECNLLQDKEREVVSLLDDKKVHSKEATTYASLHGNEAFKFKDGKCIRQIKDYVHGGLKDGNIISNRKEYNLQKDYMEYVIETDKEYIDFLKEYSFKGY